MIKSKFSPVKKKVSDRENNFTAGMFRDRIGGVEREGRDTIPFQHYRTYA